MTSQESVVRFKCHATDAGADKRKIKSVCQFFDGETGELLAGIDCVNNRANLLVEANSLFYHPPKDGPSIPYESMKKGMAGLTPEQFVEYVKQKRDAKKQVQAKL